ncbi:MAG: hypothetical protein IK066_06025 [Kiritimatiellae bacterium]|nr:hypothetical protein [Kiritimatiellia bacterium]
MNLACLNTIPRQNSGIVAVIGQKVPNSVTASDGAEKLEFLNWIAPDAEILFQFFAVVDGAVQLDSREILNGRNGNSDLITADGDRWLFPIPRINVLCEVPCFSLQVALPETDFGKGGHCYPFRSKAGRAQRREQTADREEGGKGFEQMFHVVTLLFLRTAPRSTPSRSQSPAPCR